MLKNPTLQQTIIQSTVKPSVAQKYLQTDYPTFRPVTKSSYKQQTSHRNHFADHKFSQSTTILAKQSRNYPFFLRNKNKTNKYYTRNQPHHYAQNYFPSDDEEYYNQNHQ